MKLIIVSGRSGSGKSTALHALEDEGYYCVDNLPANMLTQLPSALKDANQKTPKMAISVDVRNIPGALIKFPVLLQSIRNQNLNCLVLFLDADTQTLINRYHATHRKHPLANELFSLANAIETESSLLAPLLSVADMRLDTSLLSVNDIRIKINQLLFSNNANNLTVILQSFGFKHGVPLDADMIFDVRCLPNPYWVEELREYTGKDTPVQDFLNSTPSASNMHNDIANFITKWLPEFEEKQCHYMNIAIGCTGGKHRSVYVTELLSQTLNKQYSNTKTLHRELSIR